MTGRSFGEHRDWLLRFSPVEQRPLLTALFEAEAEVGESLRPGLEHDVAHARLAWWAEELDRLSRGEPRHPTCRTLCSLALARGASPPDLTALIEHTRVALATVAFLSRDELAEHAAQWAAAVFRQVALAGVDPSSTESRAAAERFAAEAGPALRELEWLERFSQHAQRGRIYWPLGDPPEDHRPWAAKPLATPQRELLDDRRLELTAQVRLAASRPATSQRPMLRTALLWSSLAIAEATYAAGNFGDDPSGEARRMGPTRRTIRAWRDALALSRGSLPRSLRD